MAARVLIVGGHSETALRDQVVSAGFECRTTDTVDRAALDTTDCVLVPDSTDDPVTRIERLLDSGNAPPVILCSSDPTPELVTGAFRAGAADHVDLSGPEDLGERLQSVIEDSTDADRERALRQREAALSELYEAVQRLLLATSPEEIATIAVETASDALDLPITGVYRHEDGRGLVPVALTDAVEELFGTVTLDPGESLAWDAFEAGETRIVDDVPAEPNVQNPETPIRTELYVPFGDEWLLVSGSTEAREFDDYQIDFAELLATTAGAAIRRAERETTLSQYETIFRTIDERVCVVDREGRLRMVNDALCSFLGRSESALLGEHAGAFVADEDLDAIYEAVDDLGYAKSTTVETHVGPDPGDRLPCELDVATLPRESRIKGVAVVVHDISDRKRVESALEQERDRFAELFEHVPDPVVEAEFVDDEPFVRSVNAAFEETFDTEESVAVGEPLNDFVLPPEGGDHASDLDQRTASGELVEIEVKRETGDGIRYFLFRGIPIDVAGTDRPLAFGIYTDITDQRLRERRLGVLNRVFRHNIRNDVNVVLGRAEYLAAADDPDEVETHAEIIRRNAQRIVDLSDGIHAAEQALSLEDAPRRPMDDVVRDAVDPYRDDGAVSLTVRIPEKPLPAIDERLRVAVEELVDNAIEHVPDDPVEVHVAVEPRGESVSVAVSDDGPGIPEAERAAIESGTETPLEHGSGVGLWLVSWVATALGGEVTLETDECGTTVRLTFPETALESRTRGGPDGDDGE